MMLAKDEEAVEPLTVAPKTFCACPPQRRRMQTNGKCGTCGKRVRASR